MNCCVNEGVMGVEARPQYKINFSTSQSVTDNDLFMFTFVPLQINCTANDLDKDKI
jgi:hypothetical protein